MSKEEKPDKDVRSKRPVLYIPSDVLELTTLNIKGNTIRLVPFVEDSNLQDKDLQITNEVIKEITHVFHPYYSSSCFNELIQEPSEINLPKNTSIEDFDIIRQSLLRLVEIQDNSSLFNDAEIHFFDLDESLSLMDFDPLKLRLSSLIASDKFKAFISDILSLKSASNTVLTSEEESIPKDDEIKEILLIGDLNQLKTFRLFKDNIIEETNKIDNIISIAMKIQRKEIFFLDDRLANLYLSVFSDLIGDYQVFLLNSSSIDSTLVNGREISINDFSQMIDELKRKEMSKRANLNI